MNIYYVYVYKRKDTGEIIYVGRGRYGVKNRYARARNLEQHHRVFRWKNHHDVAVHIHIVADNLPNKAACLLEASLVTTLRLNGNLLLNKSRPRFPLYLDVTTKSGVQVTRKKVLNEEKRLAARRLRALARVRKYQASDLGKTTREEYKELNKESPYLSELNRLKTQASRLRKKTDAASVKELAKIDVKRTSLRAKQRAWLQRQKESTQ